MNREKDKQAINAAKLYYRSDYSQQRIAEELGISRPSVSRLLQYAKEKGYVKIQIFDPIEDMSHMEQELKERFSLYEVKIASATINDEQDIKKYIGRKAAEYLDSIVSDGDIIGVGWGTTLYHMSSFLIPKKLRSAQIVQMEGGVTHSRWRNYAKDILESFAANYSASGQYLPLPVVFDNKEIKEMVDNDRHISRVLEMGRQANIALFSVGTVRDDALFFRLGYTDEQVNADIQQNAAGDIYSRFFDCDGKICNKELDDRTVGLRLADLQSKEHSILLSGGEAKLRAIRAALKGGYANVLITDQFTARSLLSVEE